MREDMEKRLVQKVFEHDLLYAVDSVHYRDRHMRAMAWQEIGRDLGIPASQCKDMWRKLRNCYLNAINRRQTKNIPKWKYEDEMSFLLPFLDVRSPEADMELQTSGLNNLSGSFHNGSIDNAMLSEREDSSELILPEPSSFVPKKEPNDEHLEVLSMSRRKTTPRGGPPTIHDETEMFFLSISETVKRLPAVDQARIKMEVCKMVYEAEIRQLEAEYEETL
ncbi:uncharacterized protein CDAR_123731 [Caerostris darwini]|uniref:Transcription factor Adf-1 n=1 Tax=Caerostris darwini TaxID=1538125 RepID=A0AAV4WWI8_9ARAC|nr:uncharacterized protein CDAR_123731 [Caerostris darwini]